jgi:hypothetical protein
MWRSQVNEVAKQLSCSYTNMLAWEDIQGHPAFKVQQQETSSF